MQLDAAQQFIYVSRYSRWIEPLNRREIEWSETTKRYFDFFKDKLDGAVPKNIWTLAEKLVNEMGVMPSMRSVWGAGDALKKNHIIGYNCCYVPFQDLQAAVELFYILMCGTGVGFSVEKRYIDQIPDVPHQTGGGAGIHTVGDSREGWADSFKALLNALWEGKDIQFDYSKVRPRGSRLKTMGGRASGPEPLQKLHEFTRGLVLRAQGRQLNSEEWLDIGNIIGDVVVVGGVRRSSEINFSDLDDDLIRHAKDGAFPPHRYNSNNSAVYYAKPDSVTFMREWASLAASGRGERGFFNLAAVKNHLPSRRKWTDEFRTNPCGEIILRPFQFCNLSEVVVRGSDDFDELISKVKAAVWLGAMQSTLTDFPYIRPLFKKNCEEERLLGVSLTGQMDNPKLMTEEKLEILKKYAIKEAKKAATALGINFSAAVTTGKPSGTVSQLVNCASGGHPRYAKYYWRRYRLAGTDPLFNMMRDQGVRFTPENDQGPETVFARRKEMMEKYGRTKHEAKMLVPDWNEKTVNTWVCAFPIKAPKDAIVVADVTAIQQLEWYLKLRSAWCEHNQSITVYVKDEEWMRVGAWVYDHFDELVGVSFLPADNHKYEQAPYEEITETQYEKAVAAFPKIDYGQLSGYELEDGTMGAKELACSSGSCEIA
jgi:ribonucleoside-diphosphate reductase alpha chain